MSFRSVLEMVSRDNSNTSVQDTADVRNEQTNENENISFKHHRFDDGSGFGGRGYHSVTSTTIEKVENFRGFGYSGVDGLMDDDDDLIYKLDSTNITNSNYFDY